MTQKLGHFLNNLAEIMHSNLLGRYRSFYIEQFFPHSAPLIHFTAEIGSWHLNTEKKNALSQHEHTYRSGIRNISHEHIYRFCYFDRGLATKWAWLPHLRLGLRVWFLKTPSKSLPKWWPFGLLVIAKSCFNILNHCPPLYTLWLSLFICTCTGSCILKVAHVKCEL